MVNDSSDELNNLIKTHDFNSIYFIDCLQETDETLSIFGKLYEQEINTKENMLDS